ncbi:MAG: matrixin family metalloprotease [Dehalococcoidia bacterium]
MNQPRRTAATVPVTASRTRSPLSRTVFALFPAALVAAAILLLLASGESGVARAAVESPIVEVEVLVAVDGPDEWVAKLLVDTRLADPEAVARDWAPGGIVIEHHDDSAEAAFVRWATWADEAMPVPFLYNGANGLPSVDLLKATEFAMQQWNGAGGHYFRLEYQGTTTALPAVCNGVPARDGMNVIGWNASLPTGVLGSTCALITNGPKGRMPVETDITMSSVVGWTDTELTPSHAFDLWSTVLHEFGHVVGLDHSTTAGSVMKAAIAPGQQTRVLSDDDLAGIRALYPDPSALPSPSPTPTPTPTPTATPTPVRPPLPNRLQLAGPIVREP